MEDEGCAYTFNDAHCDSSCDRREHLFDAFDCAPAVGECAHERHCAQRFADGTCDHRCNNAECQFDGGDCIASALDLAPHHILLKVEQDTDRHDRVTSHRSDHSRSIARVLSAVTRSTLRVVRVPRPSPSEVQVDDVIDANRASIDSRNFGYNFRTNDVTSKLTNVALRLDNTQCLSRCLREISHVARFLTLYDVRRNRPDLKIRSVTGAFVAVTLLAR